MPPAFVQTIREEIYYEYAKLISRSAYDSLERGFITDRFKNLRDGEITISRTITTNYSLSPGACLRVAASAKAGERGG